MQMKKIIILVLLSLISVRALGAGPIMHVALGEYWLEQVCPQYTEEERKLFLLGSVFPDIRYLAQIDRSQTHKKNVHLRQVKATKSTFEQGILFHCYVDDYRKQWLKL